MRAPLTIRGNIFILFLVTFPVLLCSAVTMRILTTDGEQCEVAGVGQPFILEVIVEGVQGSVAAPTIEVNNDFFMRRTGMYMSSINGVSTTKFSYNVRIDTVGTYTIGPARIKQHNQQDLVSNSITVTVDMQPTLTQAHKKNKKSKAKNDMHKAFLRLQIDKNQAVVGQKITGTLQFFYNDSDIKLTHIGQPDIPGFTIKKINQPRGGTAEIEGVEYHYAEWQWDMYPTTTGEHVIPAYSADYEFPGQDNSVPGSLFMFFHGSPMERKKIYSNAIKTTINALPVYKEKISAVGTFNTITATIQPPVTKVGEGMIFTLEIEGDGNWDEITPPILTLPQELKYYESRSSCDEKKGKKQFEFIIQALQPGDWEIPEQSFTFFDIHKMEYKTIHSSSLLVTIMPQAVVSQQQQHHRHDDTVKADIPHPSEQNHDTIRQINECGPWHCTAKPLLLPWTFMQIILLLPLMVMIIMRALSTIVTIGIKNKYIRKQYAFRTAYKALHNCSVQGDTAALYTIFKSLFATLEREHMMHNTNDQEWNKFLSAITQAAYRNGNNSNHYSLCQTAEQWINRLKRIM